MTGYPTILHAIAELPSGQAWLKTGRIEKSVGMISPIVSRGIMRS